MHQLILGAALACALPAAAAAQAQPRTPASPPAAADTVKLGKYDLEITTDDGTMVGALTVKREGDRHVAAINAGGREPEVKSFVRAGREYVLTGGHGTFAIVYKFKFSRDSVAGSFQTNGGTTGTVLGVFRP
jgi:hypothetical protein